MIKSAHVPGPSASIERVRKVSLMSMSRTSDPEPIARPRFPIWTHRRPRAAAAALTLPSASSGPSKKSTMPVDVSYSLVRPLRADEGHVPSSWKKTPNATSAIPISVRNVSPALGSRSRSPFARSALAVRDALCMSLSHMVKGKKCRGVGCGRGVGIWGCADAAVDEARTTRPDAVCAGRSLLRVWLVAMLVHGAWRRPDGPRGLWRA